MTEEVLCSTSKQNIANDSGSVQFKCPKCSKVTVIRSSHSRQIVSRYECQECGFEGP